MRAAKILFTLALVFCLLSILGGCSRLNRSDQYIFSLEDVVKALGEEGVHLSKAEKIYSPPRFVYYGIKPAIFKLEEIPATLYIYRFGSYDDRIAAVPSGQSYNEDLRELLAPESKTCMFYVAKNILLALCLTEDTAADNMKVFKHLESIGDIFFKRLNGGKTIVYKGESPHWQGEIILKYYEHLWKNNKGIIQRDSYHTMQPVIKYRGSNVAKPGEVSCRYKDSSYYFSTFYSKLDKDYYLYGPTSGSSGALPGFDEVIAMTLMWNGNEELLEFRASSL